MKMNIRLIAAAFVLAASAGSAQAQLSVGKAVYEKTCATCHAAGLAGAPKPGVTGDWMPRISAGGPPRLYKGALQGTAKGMPPKGGNAQLSDAEVKSAVDYMVSLLPKPGDAASAKAATKPTAAKSETAKSEAAKPETKEKAETVAKVEAPAKAAPSATAAAPAPQAAPQAAGDINAFNRLLKPASKRNLPPAEDGIHDPANDGTLALQPPLAAFGALPKSFAGNRVNWVQALGNKSITPRWDRNDGKAEPIVMDLNIVREVKGSMPDVVYPHKQHTEWLDCSNCHPAIFVPQKGANQISMASILLGQQCGVCHGKVAFPVSECRLCHSKKKDQMPKAATASAGGGAAR